MKTEYSYEDYNISFLSKLVLANIEHFTFEQRYFAFLELNEVDRQNALAARREYYNAMGNCASKEDLEKLKDRAETAESLYKATRLIRQAYSSQCV